MSYQEHKSKAEAIVARCAIITVSDTRTEQTDTSGRRMRELIAGHGHTVVHYQVVRDEPGEIEPLLVSLLRRDDVDCVLTTGGTGISGRDQTIDVVRRHLRHTLPGFGELFRLLSYQQIGSGAMLSQSLGGVARAGKVNKLLFAMPGSTKAVDLAMSQLILPELGHLLHELRK